MKHILTAALAFTLLHISAQVNINLDTPVLITFGSTLTGVEQGVFTASGFQGTPSTGRLNSNAWSVQGFTGGDLNFGSTVTSGHLAMGTTTMPNPVTDMGATVGGIYAFTGSPFTISDPAMLIQPTDADCTPGAIILKVKNNHPTNTIYLLDLNYDLWMRNNTATSTKVSFSWSEDAVTYTAVPSLDYTSPGAATATGIENTGAHVFTIIGCDVTPGEYLYLKWSFADVTGTGERDEFYMDDISVAATNLLPLTLLDFTGVQKNDVVELTWTTVSEVNTSGFIIQRRNSGEYDFKDIGTLAASGNSTTPLHYGFTDDEPEGGMNYYRLKQLDADGNFTFSPIINVNYGGSDNDLLLYPNPVSDHISVQSNKISNATSLAVHIYDNFGREIQLPLLVNGEYAFTFSTQHIPPGIYTVTLFDGYTISSGVFVKL